MSTVNFEQLHRRYRPEIEQALQRYVPDGDGILGQFYGMLHYHLGWTDEKLRPVNARAGKRLRPTLCLASCEAAGGDYRRALPAAAALELLHNYSLIHDDIEDNSETRRHRLTVWKIWGQAMAINAGDGLCTLARMAILDLPQAGVDPAVALEAARLLDRTSLSLCEGQHLDMAFETMPSITANLYTEMISKKTASLIACSAQIGALVASGDVRRSEPFREFGHLIGMAFQVQDDVLGIWGAADVTGKGATDIRQGKKTLPVVYALENAGSRDRAILLRLYDLQPLSDAHVVQVVEILDRCGARQFAESEAWRYYRAATALLTSDGFRGQDIGNLKAIADFLVGRES